MDISPGYAIRAVVAAIISTLPRNSEYLIPDYNTAHNWLIEDEDLAKVLSGIGVSFTIDEDDYMLSFFS
ncbi:uncharacterized protein MCYG_00952 [Microsporum canis CBS 113480]|uniref:Uncharacterized protein n=1 Tax=Arthroderma otae (strain ATCC MYA-4605 / CBS 113480) TaxID=554155 RepID=C5FE30_ARTOC|nr:uncharacterized protein MCYG_00952 [Microsporum canis CBS 113480]EEQ28064.1 predicted protein [Microsporum canis CBS 113480]